MRVKNIIERRYEIPFEDVVKCLGKLASKGTLTEEELERGGINLDESGDFFSLIFWSEEHVWVEEEEAA